ncbi:MAG: hypothetical protein KDM81_23050, partial [Verrucomicrobiae bacterium]|nr:hypothetical protein [Verrucomicrobiae bacterium]
SMMGTNAQAAVPDLIDCLEHCPQLHYVDTTELLNTLGEVSGASRTAIPFLTHYARDYLSLRAAVVAYFIDGQTNLLVETCQRLAQQNPLHLLRTHELYWLREDHLLNQHLVPLFEQLHSDPRCGADERRSVLFELECRGGDAEEALNRLRDRQPESSGARDSRGAQIRNPRSEGGVGTARPGTVYTA